MAVNSAAARIFGSDKDAVYIGDLGATMPTGLANPGAAFTDAGWLSDDGITLSPDDSVDKIRGFQGGGVVRTVMKESGKSFKFTCLESTALTLGLQHNITKSTTTSGVATITATAASKIENRAFIIDLFDADDSSIQYRYLIPNGEIGERADVSFTHSEVTGYEFTVEIIGDYTIITNDPNYVGKGA